MALGKAFIEVHADTKPFARELASELNKIIRASEKSVKVSSENVGKKINDGIGDGIKKNSRSLNRTITNAITSGFGQDLGKKFTSGIIDSLDDGLSGLPAEVKVALGAALLAITPLIAGAITTLVSATIAAAFGGIGVLIAAQFQDVQTAWESLLGNLRNVFLGNGSVFVQPVLNAFDMIRERLFALEGWFQEIFAVSATYIEPLTEAFLGFVEGLLPGLLDSLRNVGSVLPALVDGFRTLGRVIGQALVIITGTEYANDAFRDLVFVLGSAILATAILLRTLTEIYGTLRDISLLLSGPQGWAQLFAENAADDYAEKVNQAADANGTFTSSLQRMLSPTEEQEKALAALNQQISQLQQLILASVNNEIAWEQAIDDFTATVKENGKSLELTGQAGRNNARALVELANTALKTRADQIALGTSTDEAQAAFERQRAKIYELAAGMGLSKTRTEELIGELLRIPAPKESGVTQATITRLIRAIALAKSLGGALGSAAGIAIQIGAQPHAEGGVFNRPHLGMVAEAGPEAIIPLNNPARAQQVMAQAGLGGMGTPNVNVYIGNEQIDAYIDTRTNQSMTTTARELAYGGRGI